MKKKITLKNILRQLKADLIGKDSYRGVTLTYSWLANQFGHFSLGFIPTILIGILLARCTNVNNPAFIAAIGVSLIWLLFELYNFLGPLLFKRKYVFSPAWGNVAFDTFTDLCFFWVGAFLASLLKQPPMATSLIVVIISAILLYPSYYWYQTKMYLQYAQYPFQFRLSQWNAEIENNKSTVDAFLNKKDSGNHLLVFGTRKSGKTSLSVGIATEFSIKHTASMYTTAMKLYGLFSEPDNVKDVWTWRTASLLIIDDINPGSPIADIVTPQKFYELLTASPSLSAVNQEAIKDKNVIWVLGSSGPYTTGFASWESMLEKIGVNKNKISRITLKTPS